MIGGSPPSALTLPGRMYPDFSYASARSLAGQGVALLAPPPWTRTAPWHPPWSRRPALRGQSEIAEPQINLNAQVHRIGHSRPSGICGPPVGRRAPSSM